MNLKDKTVSFFLSKINTDLFSRVIKKIGVFQPPYKFAAQKLIDYKFPRHIFIETTSICNLKCKMCPRNYTQMKLGSMEMQLFKKIVDEAREYGERTFSLHLFGEPLIDKTIIEKIKYIKKSNPKNSIILTTNGALLNQNLARGFIENAVDKIAVSIHSPNPETYKKITGRGELENIEKNIRELARLKKILRAKKPVIFLRVVKIKENADEIKEFRKKWKNFPAVIEIRDGHNYGGKIENNKLKTRPKKRYPCYHLWFAPAINFDGEVSICCDDAERREIIGNIKKENLSKIWQGKLVNHYRKCHLKGDYGKISICGNCDVWDIYPDIFFKWQKK